jgi:hypothetical protein
MHHLESLADTLPPIKPFNISLLHEIVMSPSPQLLSTLTPPLPTRTIDGWSTPVINVNDFIDNEVEQGLLMTKNILYWLYFISLFCFPSQEHTMDT